jgi:Na+-translocating ferredoxin:NAD+ oxidoreductase subunit G
MIISSISKNAMILGAFALVSIGLTSVTYLLTKDKIQSEKELALFKALSELVPSEQFANDPYYDCTLMSHKELLGSNQPQAIWRLRDANQQPVAAVISSVAPNGYSGSIELIVGHYTDGRLAGVRVTEHQETPGLGDKIERQKSDWILSFNQLNPQQLSASDWQVKKDGGQFDAFTGATITPRAVVAAVKRNIDFFKANQSAIFTAPNNCFIEPEPKGSADE